MTPERWGRIKSLFQEALQQEPSRREAFVAEKDPQVASEVLALLAEEAKPGGVLGRDEPPRPQQRFILERELGRGAMGRVVAASDVKLGRKVALKFLQADGADSGALRRFEREARAAAQLNHPNIMVVYDVEEVEGQPCIVTELLEGKSFRALLREGPLPIDAALDFARQLAEGLAAAHATGVVHRDLKPENLFVTGSGRLKILDFGLARLLQASPRSVQTQPGVMIGTPRYMSPEQVRASPADARSDVFAFGSILYEMLAGAPAFDRPTTVEAMAAILNADPEPLPEGVPPHIRAIVERCLQKDPARRFASGAELVAALSTGKVPPLRRHFRLAIAVAAALALAAAAAAWFATRRAPAAAQDRSSIAVLPFVNMGPGKDDEYLSDGFTEELINALANLEGVRVVSRTAAFAYKGRDVGLDRIARDLNVGVVLEGSVRRERDEVRVTAQLIDARSGFHLWSKTYDRKLAGVFALEDEVARAIATSLRPQLQQPSFVKLSTANTEAHDLYLRGRFFWNQRSPEGMQKAVAAFRKAIELDPNYALAYAGLADSYALAKRWPTRPAEHLELARSLAQKALALDDSLAEAHATLGLIDVHLYDWEGAERELKRAIELKPSYATAHHWYALAVVSQGRCDEARSEIVLARQLDPTSPPISRMVAGTERACRNPDRAIELFQKALELDPTHSETLGELASVYAESGRYAEALAALDKVTEDMPYLGVRVYALERSGDRAGALRVLAQMEERAKRQYVFPQTFAYAYIGLGDADRAFEALERSYADRDLMYVKIQPFFDPLRPDPRFHALLRKMNLE